ncbi:Pyridoxal phosphate (PLP)-dependent transferases superfamily protein isoform 1 [Hibiscus syriacus]|uniref:Pyridoxal phosphate (PLP)-dependent transferases superfamily protein isoform 1 n=1 Tax=Hibiscus syriacus TaxID=106335 RepID=A0A6A2ZZC8_HIBSY|nr:diacylglycerol O-acyltransferase 3-like [Hibiscus syriacus]KAE8697228.1 Pyridoxal phosphate (PLP)-dependent transferases superfamily protein isoform 1 [Hibiscus syriacus]
METAGIVCRTVSGLPAARVDIGGRFSGELNIGVGGSRVSVRSRIKSCRRLSFQFSDLGRVQYYAAPSGGCDAGGVATKKGKGKSTEIRRVKEKLKLMKRLSKDLSMLPHLAAGQDIRIGLAAEVKVTMIQEASNVLLAQLQKLKLEQKELKRKLKEGQAQLNATLGKSESSSSSSESSDSDCGEVVDMKTLRSNALKPSLETEAPTDNALERPQEIEIEAAPMVAEESILANSLLELENSDSSPKIRVRVPLIDGECCSLNSFNADHSNSGTSTKKIEVCMGGKCKKLGAAALLEEFEKKVGAEATVATCKCMGKCRTAPNVRVSNTQRESASRINEDSVRLGINPTCTGVGLHDVDLIVAYLLCKDIDNECLMLSS